MGINNPIPRSLRSETKKASNILRSFVKPNQVLGAEEVIPPEVLRNAKGLAILTVFKAGFLFSARGGSGLVVSRLKDGTWSAPSAITMAGGGAGGMIGAELTDFVFILNTSDAVKNFSQFGSITLGGNVSVAAGPLGRSAEASAAASTKGLASVFAYSKTKGLFAGISLEGSVLIERRETNRKVYGSACTAKMILSGRVDPPSFAEPLYKILESRVFSYTNQGAYYDNDEDLYGDIPSSFESEDSRSVRSSQEGGHYSRSSRGRNRSGSAFSDDFDDYNNSNHNDNDFDDFDDDNRNSRNGRHEPPAQDSARDYYRRARASSQSTRTRWEDDIYDTPAGGTRASQQQSQQPSRPRSEKPDFGLTNNNLPKAVGLYTFKGEQNGDLSFKKGDVISIVKKSESTNDWWTGRINGQEGIFPANYVELV